MKRILFLLLLLELIIGSTNAQIFINEASNRNNAQITDEDGDSNDWIELFNASPDSVNLSGWTLSDNWNNLGKWEIGNTKIETGKFLLIQASGKDRKPTSSFSHWESAVMPEDLFSYIVPNENTPNNWMQPNFDATSWGTGRAGFGYGDRDDSTTVFYRTLAINLRIKFKMNILIYT